MRSVLDSRQLLAARVLADTGSFTLAGQQLSLTQSAVSHAIKALEEEVECRLFVRTGRGVTVTAAGRHLLAYTDQIIAQMETARTLVGPRTTRGKDRLRIGVSKRVREFMLPVVLPAFQREYSNKLVTIDTSDQALCLELLQSGLLDLVFTVRTKALQAFGFIPLFQDELRFMVGPRHPWARGRRPSREAMSGDILLAHQGMNCAPLLIAEHFELEKIAPRHLVEVPEYKVIMDLARTNQAVGILPPWLLSKELAEGELVSLSIGSRPLLRQWGLAYEPRRPMAAMDRRFVELCEQAVPGLLSRLQGLTAAPLQKKDSASAPLPIDLGAYAESSRSA